MKFKQKDIKEAIRKYYDGVCFNCCSFFKDFEKDKNLKKLVLYCIEESLKERKYKFQVILSDKNVCVLENEAVFLVPFYLYPSYAKGEVKKIILKHFDKWKNYLRSVNESSKHVVLEGRKEERKKIKKKIREMIFKGYGDKELLKNFTYPKSSFGKDEIGALIDDVRKEIIFSGNEDLLEKEIKKQMLIAEKILSKEFDIPIEEMKKHRKEIMKQMKKRFKRVIENGEDMREIMKEDLKELIVLVKTH